MLNSNVVQSHSNNLYCSFITTIKRIKQPASIEGIQWTLLANWACHKGRRPRPRSRPSVCRCCAAPFKLTEFPHELNFPAKRNERKKRIFHASTGRQDVAGRWACWPYYRVLEAHCRHFSHFAAVCRRCCCCCTINDTWQVPYNLYRTKNQRLSLHIFFIFIIFQSLPMSNLICSICLENIETFEEFFKAKLKEIENLLLTSSKEFF